VFSYAFDRKRVTTVRDAAGLHKRSVGIVEEIFNHGFRLDAIRDLRVDDSIVTVVSAKNTAIAELRRIFIDRAIALARLRVDNNRSTL
jgi:hypothetical protein